MKDAISRKAIKDLCKKLGLEAVDFSDELWIKHGRDYDDWVVRVKELHQTDKKLDALYQALGYEYVGAAPRAIKKSKK